jgi:hypothetical protein
MRSPKICPNSKQISKAHVYRVTKFADLDSWLKIKIKIIHFYLTFSPPSEISRTAVDQLALPYSFLSSHLALCRAPTSVNARKCTKDDILS